MQTVAIEVTRALRWDGSSVPVGTTIKASPLEAQQLLDSGRARLVHAADLAQCQVAVRADVARQLKQAGRLLEVPPADWPWQRRP